MFTSVDVVWNSLGYCRYAVVFPSEFVCGSRSEGDRRRSAVAILSAGDPSLAALLLLCFAE